jgi:hypothetical protein
MSTTEKLARYETALEIYNTLIADRSAAIAIERAKVSPDASRIDALIQEQVALRSESFALGFDDSDSIERVINTHGPVIKAENERLRKLSPSEGF